MEEVVDAYCEVSYYTSPGLADVNNEKCHQEIGIVLRRNADEIYKYESNNIHLCTWTHVFVCMCARACTLINFASV